MLLFSHLWTRPAHREKTAHIDGIRAISFIWVFLLHFFSILYVAFGVDRLQPLFNSHPTLVRFQFVDEKLYKIEFLNLWLHTLCGIN